MIFDQVTDTEMQAARILTGATMAAFLAAAVFRQHARRMRVVVLCIYIAGILALIAYVLV